MWHFYHRAYDKTFHCKRPTKSKSIARTAYRDGMMQRLRVWPSLVALGSARIGRGATKQQFWRSIRPIIAPNDPFLLHYARSGKNCSPTPQSNLCSRSSPAPPAATYLGMFLHSPVPSYRPVLSSCRCRATRAINTCSKLASVVLPGCFCLAKIQVVAALSLQHLSGPCSPLVNRRSSESSQTGGGEIAHQRAD